MPLVIEARGGENISDMFEDGMASTASTLQTEVSSIATSNSTVTTLGEIRCVNECDVEHFRISSCIITLGLIAMIENVLLQFAVATMKLGTRSKMLAFLWHFSLADTIIAFTFVFYHCRTIVCCPNVYTCDPRYHLETYFIQTMFTTSLLVSYFFVLAATIDTLIAVRWPLWYSTLVTTRRVRVVSAIIWVATLAISTMGVILMIFWDRKKGHSVLTFVIACVCILTAASVIGINVAIIVSAWMSINKGTNDAAERRRRQLRSENVNTVSRTLSNRSGISLASFQLNERQKQNRKLTVTLLMFVGAFLVSCVPWPTTLLICKDVQSCQLKSSQVYILVLVLLHTVIVPIIYGFRIEEVKLRLKKIFCTVFQCEENDASVSN